MVEVETINPCSISVQTRELFFIQNVTLRILDWRICENVFDSPFCSLCCLLVMSVSQSYKVTSPYNLVIKMDCKGYNHGHFTLAQFNKELIKILHL